MATNKLITFVDTSVLINAAVGPDAARRMRALTIIGDPKREFVATRFLVLEVTPIPTKFQKEKNWLSINVFSRMFRPGLMR
jgi:hypothetical protein